MSLESHLPSERINVRRLSIEQPEIRKELLFDVERDIAEADWEKMFNQVAVARRINSWGGLSALASKLCLIDSEKLGRLDITDKERQQIADALAADMKRGNWGIVLAEGVGARALTGQTTPHFDAAYSEAAKYVLNSYQDPQLELTAEKEVQLRLLFPNQTCNLRIDDNLWERLINRYKSNRDGIGPNDEYKAWGDAKFLRLLKILDTGRVQSLLQTDVNWPRFKKALEAFRGKSGDSSNNFADHALSLKVLAADEVKITDEGLLDFISRPTSLHSASAAPEARKF